MGKTLTIIAKRPEAHPGPEGKAIDAVLAKLSPLDSQHHRIERASTLRRVKRLLLEHKLGAGDRLQIVGHGAPGRLWLSGSWTGADANGSDVFVLDSNPNFYGILADNIPAGCRVSLLGCTVGARSVLSRIADGPTLLFDLARMWDCEVIASTGYVDANDFDAEGMFMEVVNGQSRVRVASSKQIRIDEEARVEPLATVIRLTPAGLPATPTPIGVNGVVGSPMIGPSGWFGLDWRQHPLDDGESLRKLDAFVGHEVDASSLLAAPELCVAVTIDGRPAEGEIIGNGRLLRVRQPTEVRHFELGTTPADRQTAQDAMRAVVETFRPS